MKVLVIGGGGREHAIVWKLAQSRSVDKIYCCPGNAGIAGIAECIDVSQNDFKALLDFVKYEWIDLTIVGPEDPLSKGIVDIFENEGRKILGPSRAAAQLESSKVFSKDLMRSHNIPSAEYKVFTSYLHAEEYIRVKGTPIVIKADGLAAGKGVFVASNTDEAMEALRPRAAARKVTPTTVVEPVAALSVPVTWTRPVAVSSAQASGAPSCFADSGVRPGGMRM